jgi:hypothetical protein
MGVTPVSDGWTMQLGGLQRTKIKCTPESNSA